MTKFKRIGAYLLAALLLGACGANKKLEVVKGQADELVEQNQQLKSKVSSLQSEVSNCSNSYNTTQDELARYKNENAVLEEKLKSERAILDEQYAIMQEIDHKIETALADFKDKGVEVYFRKGYVHVSMEDNLLYKSGSAKLAPKGIEALGTLANVLNGYPNLKVIVLGNTDDVKFRNGMDNWTLSTERANGVVRILNDTYKVDPMRLTTAGKGKYNPVVDNDTEAGRAKNRRTDIILNPDLDKIWESIER